MKTIAPIFGSVILIVGFLLDVFAISYFGSYLFVLGFTILCLSIIIDHKKYLSFFHDSKEHKRSGENVALLLIKNIDKLFVMVTCAIGILILAFSISFRSTEAFDVLTIEVKKKIAGNFKLGLVVTGETSKETSCFEFSIFEEERKYKVTACLIKKDNIWAVENCLIRPT